MQGLAAILFPLGFMLVALAMERLENLVMRGSGAVSPEQVDGLLSHAHRPEVESAEIADVSVLPTTRASTGDSTRRAS